MISILFCFLLPLLGAFRTTLVGEISLSEPLLLVFLVFNWQKAIDVFSTQVARVILLLGSLWLLSQICADLYRGTPFVDYSRGWAKILMVFLSYISCFVLIGFDVRRLVAFVLGVMFSPLLGFWIYGSDLPLYKFIFGAAISTTSFFIVGFSRQPRIVLAAIPAAAGVLALVMDSRSLAGVTFSAAAYYAMLSAGLLKPDIAVARKLLFGLIWAAIAYSSVMVYSYLGAHGSLTEDALAKYETQLGTSDTFNVFMGRSEIYYTIPKIIESPIVGFGSWAKDIDYVTMRSLEHGIDPTQLVAVTGGLIPSHSHLFGAWLEAGLMGAIFWFYILMSLGKVFINGALSSVGRWSGICSFMLIVFAWDILFSPFGGERRVNNGYYLWVVTYFVLATRQHKHQKWVPAALREVRFGGKRADTQTRSRDRKMSE